MSVYYNFLLISLVPLASARANRGVDVNGASIDFLGQSGKMKFCPTAQCEQTSMTISMNKLVELDQAAQQTNNKVPSFASQAFGTLIKNYTTTTPSGHFPWWLLLILFCILLCGFDFDVVFLGGFVGGRLVNPRLCWCEWRECYQSSVHEHSEGRQ